jgi:hypothetical protein
VLLPILHFALLDYSKHVAKFISDKVRSLDVMCLALH